MSAHTSRRHTVLWILNLCVAVGLLAAVTWGLLSTNPLRAVRNTPFRWIRHVHDVLIHLSVYAAVSVTLLPLVSDCRNGIRRLLIAAIATHAVSTELLQALIPRRTCDPVDLAANLAGIIIGLRMTSYLSRSLPELRQALPMGVAAPDPSASHV